MLILKRRPHLTGTESALLCEISSYASSVSSDDVQQRIKLLRAARSLTLALERQWREFSGIAGRRWILLFPFLLLCEQSLNISSLHSLQRLIRSSS